VDEGSPSDLSIRHFSALTDDSRDWIVSLAGILHRAASPLSGVIHEVAPDSTERQVIEKLRSAAAAAETEGWDTTRWTVEVKLRIGTLGRHHGYEVYAHEFREAGRSEWLFDLTWLKKDRNGFSSALPLILESKWGDPGEVSDDFQKLMVARARHRVIVFDQGRGERMMDGLLEEVRHFEGSTPGDRYLFAGWSPNYFSFHVVEVAAALRGVTPTEGYWEPTPELSPEAVFELAKIVSERSSSPQL
jgi:hypothetical protein